jgi:hypothetical protein
MGTSSTTQATTGAATIRANAQAAQKCSLGANGKCSFCQRTGLPILPLRYAVNPSFIKGLNQDAFTAAANLGGEVKNKNIKGHKYTLRTLRAGFVHVYMGVPGQWQLYAATDDGLLRLLPNPDDPDAKTSRSLTAQCSREGHNIPASFINIPKPYDNKTIWMAFSKDPWPAPVRKAYEKSPAQRMQSFDCAALAKAPDGVKHAFEIADSAASKLSALVDEYATDAVQEKSRRRYEWSEVVDNNKDGRISEGASGWPSAHGFFPRTAQAPLIGQFAQTFRDNTASQGKPKKVAAVALFDAVGIVEEINRTRLQVVEWRSAYCSNAEVSRARLVSQAIQGTKAIYEQGALSRVFAEKNMVIVEQNDAITQAKYPGKKLVLADNVEAIAKSTPYVWYPPSPPTMAGVPVSGGPPVKSNVWDWSRSEAAGDWRGMTSFYKEKERSTFDSVYEQRLSGFQIDLETYGEDYTQWADDPAWKTWLKDYDPTTVDGRVNCIKLCAPCLSGGPTDTITYKLWKRWLEAKPDDANNPVYQAMFGQVKTIVGYLTPDGLQPEAAPNKSDKLYDVTKAIVASKQGEELVEKLTTDSALAKSIAHLQLAVGSAVTTISSELSAGAQTIALRAQQSALHLYGKTEAVFVKLTMTIGQYVDALKAAGREYAKAARQALNKVFEEVTTQGGKKVRALVRAGLMRITDPRVRNIVIEVTLVAERGLQFVRDAAASALKQTSRAMHGLNVAAIELAGLMRTAGITVSHAAAEGVRALARGLKFSASQTVHFAAKLLGGIGRVGGAAGELVLAAGAVAFQSWAGIDSLREVRKKIGPEKTEAWLSLISAGVGVAAGGVELLGIALRQLSYKVGSRIFLAAGGVLAAVASAVDAVQAFFASVRSYKSGDTNAAICYGLASLAFFGAAAAGVAVVSTGMATGFAALTLAGPLGWAILLVAIGVGFLFLAMWAEDTPLQIWLARCYFGVVGKRREPQWTTSQHGEEMAELNSVMLGAKVEAAFNDDWNELFTGLDTINLRFTLPQFDEKESGYLVEAFAITTSGSWIPVYSRALNKTPRVNPSASEPGRYQIVPGSEKATTENGARVISVDIQVNRAVYRKAKVKLDYWPDVSDEEALLGIDRLITD